MGGVAQRVSDMLNGSTSFSKNQVRPEEVSVFVQPERVKLIHELRGEM